MGILLASFVDSPKGILHLEQFIKCLESETWSTFKNRVERLIIIMVRFDGS